MPYHEAASRSHDFTLCGLPHAEDGHQRHALRQQQSLLPPAESRRAASTTADWRSCPMPAITAMTDTAKIRSGHCRRLPTPQISSQRRRFGVCPARRRHRRRLRRRCPRSANRSSGWKIPTGRWLRCDRDLCNCGSPRGDRRCDGPMRLFVQGERGMFERMGRFFSPGSKFFDLGARFCPMPRWPFLPWWPSSSPAQAGNTPTVPSSAAPLATPCRRSISPILHSPHANVKCVECHIGRATIATQFTRKAQDITHVIQFVGADYELPIYSNHCARPRKSVKSVTIPTSSLPTR